MRLFTLVFAVLALASCATTEPARRRVRRRRPRAQAARVVARTAPAPLAQPSVPPTPTPGATSAPARAPAATARHDPRCDEVTQRNAAVLAGLASIDACNAVVVPSLRETFGRCVESRDGAWAIELVEARPRGGDACDLAVRWRTMLFHRGGVSEETDGATGRVERSFRIVADGDTAQVYTRLSFAAGDLDNDRLPELVVSESSEDHGTAHTRSAVEVYTASAGAVAVFEPTRAMTLLAAVDPDDDGRPDFIVPAPYQWSEGSECGVNVNHTPVSMLAHALPAGGFSLNDAVAAQYLRQMCPAPGASAIVPRGVDADEAEALGIVCRRLWGESPEAALSPLECRSFRPAPSARCASSTQRLAPLSADECPAHYERWATASPPLRLR